LAFNNQSNFNKANLEFYFRKNYLESQPVIGKINHVSNFVIEVSIEQNTNLVKKIRLMYVINKTIRFEKFVDFQYLSNQNFLLLEHNFLNYSSVHNINFDLRTEKNYRIIPIDIIPINFSKCSDSEYKSKQKMFDFSIFSSSFNQKISREKENIPALYFDGRSVIESRKEILCLIDFQTDEVPNIPTNKIKNKLFSIPLFLIGYMSVFLKKRPIWTRRILEKFIPISLKKYISTIMPIFCYRFGSINPFKKTWIRFGFDPRKKKKTMIYQTFVIKQFFSKIKREEKKRLMREIKNKKKFKRIYEQMCDIQLISKYIKKISSKRDLLKPIYINNIIGWLNLYDFVKIKSKIKGMDIFFSKK
jgi:hypothetical protein